MRGETERRNSSVGGNVTNVMLGVAVMTAE